MKSPLSASDLPEHIMSAIEIPLAGMSVTDEDETLEVTPKASKNEKILSAGEIQERFNVPSDVAIKLARYQSDLLAEFHDAIEVVVEETNRYLLVKPYLRNDKYDNSMLEEYVREKPSIVINPRSYLWRSLFGATTSAALLALAVLIFRNQWFGVSMDEFGGSTLAVIWGSLTLLYVLGLPKRYRTKKLLALLDKSRTR